MADILGTDGDDRTLSGTSGDDRIFGFGGKDRLYGKAGNDLLDGGAGDDLLDGGAGADTLIGGAGKDTYRVDNVGDVVTETSESDGVDTVETTIDSIIGSFIEDLTLTGSATISGTGNELANKITGNSGDNSLWGGDGADSISAGSGNDTINGGAGADRLTGGSGSDVFIFDKPSATVDSITDFATEDWIAVFASDYGLALGAGLVDTGNGSLALDPTYFASVSGTQGTVSGHGQFLYNATSRYLMWDADGSGAGQGQQIVRLQSGAVLTSSDFRILGPAAPPPLPTVSVSGGSATEASNGEIRFTFTLSTPASEAVTIQFQTIDGTAISGADFEGVTSGTVTILAGQTTATASVKLLDDQILESSEDFTLKVISAAMGISETALVVTTSEATGTILDEDTPPPLPTVSVSSATPLSQSEGPNTSIAFSISLSSAAPSNVTVHYFTSNGTAIAGSDYTELDNVVTFTAGETTKTVTVNLIDDLFSESTEYFLFSIDAATMGTTPLTIVNSTGTGTIVDNDGPPPVSMTVANIYDTTQFKAGDPSGYGSGDPSGLAYVPGLNTLFVADSEHDESPYYSSQNLFAMRPDGTFLRSYSLRSFTQEPTGLAFNPKNGYLYITDDDKRKVFWVDPSNPEVKLGEFSVAGLGMTDVEDPKFNPFTGNMYILDGASKKFFELTDQGALVRSFALPSVMTDAEALAYDAKHDVFFIASGATRGAIFEMDSSGNLLATFTLLNNYLNPNGDSKPKLKGLELAPSSDDPTRLSLYAADYGQDQENDGRVFEINLGSDWLIA